MAGGWMMVHIGWGKRVGARNNCSSCRDTEAAKETQPDAYIVGEHFGDARQWLQADVKMPP